MGLSGDSSKDPLHHSPLSTGTFRVVGLATGMTLRSAHPSQIDAATRLPLVK